MRTEYYLYYVKYQSDGKEFEDISWFCEDETVENSELETAIDLYEEQSKNNKMRLYAIYRPANKKVLLRSN